MRALAKNCRGSCRFSRTRCGRSCCRHSLGDKIDSWAGHCFGRDDKRFDAASSISRLLFAVTDSTIVHGCIAATRCCGSFGVESSLFALFPLRFLHIDTCIFGLRADARSLELRTPLLLLLCRRLLQCQCRGWGLARHAASARTSSARRCVFAAVAAKTKSTFKSAH